MGGKRKIETCSAKIECIGPQYLCPYAIRSVRRKRPRSVQSKMVLQTNDEGFPHFEVGDVIHNRYEVLSELGRGGNGIVLKVKDKELKEIVAFKTVKNNEDCHKDAVNEFLMLKLIQRLDYNNKHHFVRLIDGFCSGGHICFVMELLGLDLHQFMNYRSSTMDLFEIRSIGFQLCDAVQFLHNNKLVHNDIKPSNIAFVDTSIQSKLPNELDVPLSNTDIRVIDFGSLKSEHDDREVAITQPYRAPEVLLQTQHSSCSYDIWTIGCTLLELYTGEPLFEVDEEISHIALIEQIVGSVPAYMTANSQLFKNGKLKFDRRTKFARQRLIDTKNLDEMKRGFDICKENQFFELLKKMLTIDPEQRITATEALQHVFFLTCEPKQPNESNFHQ